MRLDSYSYSFQGQEHDDEVKGKGNSVNYKYRMHDPRIGRFFAVDPLSPKYPWYTPYSFSGNKVIAYREIEGLEETFFMPVVDAENNKMSIHIVNNYCTGKMETFFGTWDITDYTGDNAYIIGSDEKWHKIPNTWHNKSLSSGNQTVVETMDRINSWPIVSDKLFEIAENMQAIDNFINSEFGMAIGLLATNVAVLRAKAKAIKKNNPNTNKKQSLPTSNKGNGVKKKTLVEKKPIVTEEIAMTTESFSYKNTLTLKVKQGGETINVYGTFLEGKNGHVDIHIDIIPESVYQGESMAASHIRLKNKMGAARAEALRQFHKEAQKLGYKTYQFEGKRATGVRKGSLQKSRIYSTGNN